MSRWGDAKTYAWLYSVSLTDQYKFWLLLWLKEEGPPGLHALVLKELGRAGTPRAEASQGEVDRRAGNSDALDL